MSAAQDDQVHREPHRPAPVGVAAEHAGVGLGRQVVDLVAPGRPSRTRTAARGGGARSRGSRAGPRNSSSSSMTARIRRSRVLVDQRRDPPPLRVRPGQVRELGHDVREVPERTPRPARASPGSARATSPLEHRRRAQRQQADERAHLELDRPSRRASASRRSRSRPPRPTARRRRSGGFIAMAIHTKCAMNFSAMSAYTGSCVGQLDRDLQHPLAVQRHPGGAVGLLERARRRAAAPSGRRSRCCRGPRKPPWKRLRSSGSLRLTHQVKLVSSRCEHARQELAVALAADLRLALVDEQRRPRASPAG